MGGGICIYLWPLKPNDSYPSTVHVSFCNNITDSRVKSIAMHRQVNIPHYSPWAGPVGGAVAVAAARLAGRQPWPPPA